MISPRQRLGLYALIPVLVFLDQLSKWAVLTTPVFNARACLHDPALCGGIEVSPIFDLSMVWNRGVSFGTLQSDGIMRWVLVAVTLAIAVGFLVWLVRADRRLTGLSLSLVVAGAAGNLIDRIRFGAVVDFLNFSDIWFVWVFNIADAAITVGAVLLFADQFLMSRRQNMDPPGADRQENEEQA